MQFSFRKPHFWHSQNFAKTLFWHTVALFVFLKMPKKHYKTGEKTAKQNLDQFLTLDLDQFLTLETPNLGPVFNSTAYIYTYIYMATPSWDHCVSSKREGGNRERAKKGETHAERRNKSMCISRAAWENDNFVRRKVGARKRDRERERERARAR